MTSSDTSIRIPNGSIRKWSAAVGLILAFAALVGILWGAVLEPQVEDCAKDEAEAAVEVLRKEIRTEQRYQRETLDRIERLQERQTEQLEQLNREVARLSR